MSVWKACDLRGRYPDEVSPDLIQRIGRAAAVLLPPGAPVLVAGDFRLSTPTLKSALTQGLVESGARVFDGGQLPTPVAYFAHQQLATSAVFLVTASHNPAPYNGLKFMLGALPPTPEDVDGLRKASEGPGAVRAGGSVCTVDPVPQYTEWILERWSRLAPLQKPVVVLDAGGGAWSQLAPWLFERLGFTVHPLFCAIDGQFSRRSPDCARAANLPALCQAMRDYDADLGVAWDGDGDRVAFATRGGQVVGADQVAMILARTLLRGRPGAKVVYDIKLSDVLRRMVLRQGGIPLMERSGHTFLKRRMIQENCLFGCEVSGHYFYDELGGGDDGLFSGLMMCEVVAREGALHELAAALPPVFLTPDLRLPQGRLSFDAIAERLRRQFGPAGETRLDGVRLATRDGSVLVRRSVTEPVVTMRIEGIDGPALARMAGECLEALPEYAEELKAYASQREVV